MISYLRACAWWYLMDMTYQNELRWLCNPHSHKKIKIVCMISHLGGCAWLYTMDMTYQNVLRWLFTHHPQNTYIYIYIIQNSGYNLASGCVCVVVFDGYDTWNLQKRRTKERYQRDLQKITKETYKRVFDGYDTSEAWLGCLWKQAGTRLYCLNFIFRLFWALRFENMYLHQERPAG